MRLRRILTAAIALAITADAQNPKVFTSNTRLVEVEVVVRDSKGPVEGLEQNDFQLFDNGKAQKIGAFSVLTMKSATNPAAKESPASSHSGTDRSQTEQKPEFPTAATVILIDDLNTAFTDQVQSHRRIAEMLNGLPPREPVAVYVLNFTLRTLTDFTNDPVRIAKALTGAQGETPEPPNSCDGYREDATPCAEYDALETLSNQLASRPGRKNLLWISNGFPVFRADDVKHTLLYVKMLHTMKVLNQANVAIYPIAAEGVAGPAGYSAEVHRVPPQGRNLSVPRTGMDLMYWAYGTGGTPAVNTDVGFATQRALDDSRVTYVLGFYPETLDETYHQLKVKVDRTGVDVRSRDGYLASAPVDLVTNKIAGQSLETRAAGDDVGTLDASIQLPYFYTGTNRARVFLSLDLTPAGMKLQREQNGLHGQIELVGTTSRPDGESVARFAETVGVDLSDQTHADAFMHTPYHYAHQFLLAPGSYVFQMAIGAGPNALGKVKLALNIEPWNSAAFGIGGIAFSTRSVDPTDAPAGGSQLAAGGKIFIPSATDKFSKSDRIYFYTEIYEPTLTSASPAALSLGYRVVDRKTGNVQLDSGMGAIANYIQPGNPVVPFATVLPAAQLKPGLYRIEVRAAHSSGSDTVMRVIDFEMQ